MDETREGELRRSLGLWSASALIAGSMIGTGIFFFVSDVAAYLPSRTAIICAWIIGAAIASCGALSIAELASCYPETGGVYVFLQRAYGKFVSFQYSWAEFLIMRPGSLGIMAVAFAKFFGDFLGLGNDISSLWIKSVAIVAVIVLTGINIIGVRVGGMVQNLLTSIKIFCLIAIIGIGITFALGALETHEVTIEPGDHKEGSIFLLFGAALIPIMWTIGGWDESPFVAEEVRNPQRNLPLSILGGLWTVALLFVLVNVAYLAILSPPEMAGTKGITATIAMERAIGSGARKILDIALIICTLGAANGLALTGGRIAYAAGRSQALFQWFSKTHTRTKTPVRSLVAQCVITCFVVVILEDPITLLFYTGLAYWTFAGLMAASVLVMRRRDPQRKRPFRVWGYPVVPILFIAASVGMAASVVIEDTRNDTHNAIATVIILTVGAILYGLQVFLFRRPGRV